jgi:hypothetical protein
MTASSPKIANKPMNDKRTNNHIGMWQYFEARRALNGSGFTLYFENVNI